MSPDSINNDELSAFVASTLKAIAVGVTEAAAAARSQESRGHSQFEMPTKVQFEIAVSARSTGEVGGGFKIKVFDVGGEAGGKKSDENESVSRITFEVPWRYTHTAPISIPTTRNVV